ncbi:MAG: YtxH domain-containing protein [Bryobacteraceae bacterium]
MQEQRLYNRASLAGYFIAGVAAGGAAALLITPYSGRVSRNKIRNQFEEGQAKVQETTDQLADRARKAAARVSAAIEVGKEEYKAKVNA